MKKAILVLLCACALPAFGVETKHTEEIFDTGSALTINSGITLKVNPGATLDATGATVLGITASAAWGGITGTLSSQTDLQTALDAKVDETTTVNGHALSSNVTVTSSDVGLGSVTNDTQTKASIVPNTAPTAGQILVGNAGNTAYAKQTLSGSGVTATLSSSGVLTLSAIPNATLSNSAITIAGNATSLGGSITQDSITGLSSVGLVKRTAANSLTTITDNSSSWVIGPSSATNFGFPMFDGTTGKLIQDSSLVGDAVGTMHQTHTASASSVASVSFDTVSNYGGGTPSLGFGEYIRFGLEDSTTDNQEAARLSVAWTDLAHATRSAKMDFLLVDNAGAAASAMTLFSDKSLSVGSTTDPGAGFINASNGYKVGGSQIAASNLSDGTSGTGSIVLANAPTFASGITVGGGISVTSGSIVLGGIGSHVDTISGFKIGGTAAAGKMIIGNGTFYTSSVTTWPTATPGYGDIVMGDGSSWIASPIGKTIITSTVDQTATAETVHAVFTVPANSARVGTTYHIKTWGNIDNGTTAITFTPRLRWGGTGGVAVLSTPTFASSTTANTNRSIHHDAYITIITTGATGTAVASMDNIEGSQTTNGVKTAHGDATLSPVTIDTTVNKDLALTWALSSTTGTPHIRTLGGYIEIIK